MANYLVCAFCKKVHLKHITLQIMFIFEYHKPVLLVRNVCFIKYFCIDNKLVGKKMLKHCFAVKRTTYTYIENSWRHFTVLYYIWTYSYDIGKLSQLLVLSLLADTHNLIKGSLLSVSFSFFFLILFLFNYEADFLNFHQSPEVKVVIWNAPSTPRCPTTI